MNELKTQIESLLAEIAERDARIAGLSRQIQILAEGEDDAALLAAQEEYKSLKSERTQIPWDALDEAIIEAGLATEDNLDDLTGREKLELI